MSFNYAFGQQYGYSGATVQSLDFGFQGATMNTGDYNVADHGFTGWQTENMVLTATSTTETLEFFAHGNLPAPPFAMVSDVSLTAAPEPATWAMMLAGFAGLGYAGFRSSRRKAAVAA